MNNNIVNQANTAQITSSNVLLFTEIESYLAGCFYNKVVPSFFVWSSNKHRIPLIGCGVYGDVYSSAAFDLANG